MTIVQKPKPTAQPINTTDTLPELRKITLGEDISYAYVENGEKIILDVGKDVEYLVSFGIADGKVTLNVLNGDYSVEKNKVESVLLDNLPIYLGVTEFGESNAVLALGLNEDKVKAEITIVRKGRNIGRTQ